METPKKGSRLSHSSSTPPPTEEDKEEDEDRLSSLNNHLLHHILSFLPTNLVINTSILAHRWKHLWSTSPHLYFDDTLFSSQATTFPNFVERALFLHSPKINLLSFRLSLTSPDNELYRIVSLLCFALVRNVQQLHLHIVHPKNLALPSSLFHSASLRTFKFSGSLCHNFYWPSSSRLPSLQTLHLSRINFIPESSDNIISSCLSCLKDLSLENCSGIFCLVINKCPLLEDLNIQHCVGLQQLRVSARRLRKFRILDSFDASTCIKTMFAVWAPNLESFIWSDLPPFRFLSVGSISSICHSSIRYPTTSKLSIETMDGALKLLLKLCDGRKLSINAACISVLCAGAHGRLRNGKEINKFNNTEDLKAVIDFGWQVAELSSLLRSCPNLKNLEITNTQIISSSREQYACNLDIGGYWVTQGLRLNHLMEVKLLEFKGTAYELYFIELLIHHVSTLQRLTILTSMSVPLCVRSNVAQTLATVSSASPKLKLLFL